MTILLSLLLFFQTCEKETNQPIQNAVVGSRVFVDSLGVSLDFPGNNADPTNGLKATVVAIEARDPKGRILALRVWPDSYASFKNWTKKQIASGIDPLCATGPWLRKPQPDEYTVVVWNLWTVHLLK